MWGYCALFLGTLLLISFCLLTTHRHCFCANVSQLPLPFSLLTRQLYYPNYITWSILSQLYYYQHGSCSMMRAAIRFITYYVRTSLFSRTALRASVRLTITARWKEPNELRVYLEYVQYRQFCCHVHLVVYKISKWALSCFFRWVHIIIRQSSDEDKRQVLTTMALSETITRGPLHIQTS